MQEFVWILMIHSSNIFLSALGVIFMMHIMSQVHDKDI